MALSGRLAEVETPSYEERVFFLGANGTGKTVLAGQMLAPYPSAIVLDIKHDFPIPWERGDYSILHKPPGIGFLNSLAWRMASKHIIFRPVPPFDTGQWITTFLNWVFNRMRRLRGAEPCILYLDEGAWMAYSGAKTAIARIAIAGRSLKLGLWLSSQRPRGIPVEVRSEAWRWYVFYLRNRDDRKEVVSNLDYRINEWELESTTRDYEFWEIRRGKGGRMEYRHLPPVIVQPINVRGET